MIDTTPWWLIAIAAVIVILFWIAMELRHQRKNPGKSHYVFDQKVNPVHVDQYIYDDTRRTVEAMDYDLTKKGI